MIELQEIFNRIEESKKKQKDIRSMYKDLLAGRAEYQEVVEKINALKEQKKRIETGVRDMMSSEYIKLEEITNEIGEDQVLLSDIAVSKLLKGESISVTDKNNAEYEPVINVKFKKAD